MECFLSPTNLWIMKREPFMTKKYPVGRKFGHEEIYGLLMISYLHMERDIMLDCSICIGRPISISCHNGLCHWNCIDPMVRNVFGINNSDVSNPTINEGGSNCKRSAVVQRLKGDWNVELSRSRSVCSRRNGVVLTSYLESGEMLSLQAGFRI